ncbi:hypothetical protein HY640_00400 [Candidatus Woesearchaeota archaeon]|nr:hypothetical protein [Candidatus Woesearchaeota archaeon]
MRLFLALLVIAAVFHGDGVRADTAVLLQSPSDGAWFDTGSVAFTYNASSSGSVSSCSLIVNSSVKASSQQVVANQVSSLSASLADGFYSWSISCVDSKGSNSSAQLGVGVDTTRPVVYVVSPVNGSRLVNGSVLFRFNPVDSFVRNCSLFTNQTGQWLVRDSRPVFASQFNDFSAVLPDGSFLWAVRCNDSVYEQWSQNYTLTVDSLPPVVLRHSPVVSTRQSFSLNITTDENATCRYSSSNSSDFSSMLPVPVTGRVEHSAVVSGLSDGVFSYYFLCSDSMGLFMNSSYAAQVSVQLPPSAEIVLSDASPLRPGIIEVSVLASRPMPSAPQLSYSMSDLQGTKQVPLFSSGAATLWKGYLIAEDSGTRRIGTFYFSGTDDRGVSGSDITSGRYFVVDSEKPGTPASIKAVADNSSIRVSWYYDGDDVDYYNVFRSTVSGVDFTDLFASTNSTTYADASVSERATYYYRVNVVDTAGNRGAMSSEVYATALPLSAQQSQSSPVKVLPPDLVPKVDAAASKVEGLSIDLEAAGQSLKAASSSREAADVLGSLGLLSKVDEAKNKVAQLESEVSGLKSRYASGQELDAVLSRVYSEIELLRKTVPGSVEVEDSVASVQVVGRDDIAMAIGLVMPGLSNEQKSRYVEDAYRKQQDILVESVVSGVRMEFLDGSVSEKTVVTKFFSYRGEGILQDVVVVEVVPKSVASDVSELELLSYDYEILKSDPVIKWGFVELGAERKPVRFVVNRKVGASDAKSSKSVPLPGISGIGVEKQITGFSVAGFFGNSGFGKSGTVFLVVGLAAIAVLLLYYRGFGKEPGPEMEVDVRGFGNDDEYMLVLGLLGDARRFVASGSYREAEAVYSRMQEIYRQLPPELKSRVYRECTQLQGMISYRKAQDRYSRDRFR